MFITGQQDDARMNVAIALTSVRRGANVVNHTEVLALLKKKVSQGERLHCVSETRKDRPTTTLLSFLSSHRKNWFAARCEPVFAMTGKEALCITRRVTISF